MNILDDIRKAAVAASPWAHLATVDSFGCPHVVPVHPLWIGETIWIFTRVVTRKTRNIEHCSEVALHWQVDERGDGVEVRGSARLHGDIALKRRLWRRFDYNLRSFASGGPDGCPDMGFLELRIREAVWVRAFGAAGVTRWPGASPPTQSADCLDVSRVREAEFCRSILTQPQETNS